MSHVVQKVAALRLRAARDISMSSRIEIMIEYKKKNTPFSTKPFNSLGDWDKIMGEKDVTRVFNKRRFDFAISVNTKNRISIVFDSSYMLLLN